jgi:hypothetical protein
MDCSGEDRFIPAMLPGPLKGVTIPEEFLCQYQTNFAILVFPTAEGVPRADCAERVEFRSLSTRHSPKMGDFGKLGGIPEWFLEDESPAACANGSSMVFLMQVRLGYEFPKLASATAQMEFAMLDGKMLPSDRNGYQLFLGNALYFFGTTSGVPQVYVITQVE